MGGRRRVRVAVADAQPVCLAGLAHAVRQQPELEVVATARDAAGAVEAVGHERPHVAVVARELPGLDVGELLAAAHGEPPVHVLLVLGRVEPSEAFAAIEAGAAGMVTRTVTAAGLCAAVRTVARGQTVLGPEVQVALAQEIRERRHARGRAPLTDRAVEVLGLAAQGLTRDQIAAELQLAPGTVKRHLEHVYAALGVSDRGAAVAAAMRAGLLR